MTVGLSHEVAEATSDIALHVEVCLNKPCHVDTQAILARLVAAAERSLRWFRAPDARAALIEHDADLREHVAAVVIDGKTQQELRALDYYRANPVFYVHTLHDDEPEDDEGTASGTAAFTEWELPNRRFHGVWETLLFDTPVQARLLAHAATSLRFARLGVDPRLVAWNKIVLLHGPPGTGKTSLCQALAHKLSVRLGNTYKVGHLVEVNAHGLFSKYFSESGKLVAQLFAKIEEFLEERDELVCVLLDEVESVTGARAAAVAGGEPADAVRVVNALLTRLDALRRHPNVVVLCTSNMPDAIDAAFVDRADIKAYIGPPGARARYEILRSCVAELHRAGAVAGDDALPAPIHELPAALLQGTPPVASANPAAEGGEEGGSDGDGDATMRLAVKEEPAQSQVDAASLGDGCGEPCGRAQAAGSGVVDESASPGGADCSQNGALLWTAAQRCEGWSGRALRKLPFLAHSRASPDGGVVRDCTTFLRALLDTIDAEAAERVALHGAPHTAAPERNLAGPRGRS